MSEDDLVGRLCTDLSLLTSELVLGTEQWPTPGFGPATKEAERKLTFEGLNNAYSDIPGLPLDKVKGLLAMVWTALAATGEQPPRGIVFAYDEAQNLVDRPEKEQYPLALLLDAFQSLQRRGLPLMVVLAGLPTVFPKLVASRAFAERMFRVMFLGRLAESASAEAIRRPITEADYPIEFTESAIGEIVALSRGYPYFIQFICREAFDAFVQMADTGKGASVPIAAIQRKLDTDFFAGRWARATDRQRELLTVIASLESSDDEFTVQAVVQASEQMGGRPFGSSHANQMLAALAFQGLVYKNRRGKYSFSVPLLGQFIRRQADP